MEAGDTVIYIGSYDNQLKPGHKYTISKVVANYYIMFYELNDKNILFTQENFVSLSVDRNNKLLKLKERIDGSR